MNHDMITKRLQIIEELQVELSSLKETYESILEDDPSYQELMEEESRVKEESKSKKENVLSAEVYGDMRDQIKEKRLEVKEHKEALAQELVEYYREYGSLEIEDHRGNVKHVRFSVRLVN
jgi:FtsZ-binding cell division protein ZapB